MLVSCQELSKKIGGYEKTVINSNKKTRRLARKPLLAFGLSVGLFGCLALSATNRLHGLKIGIIDAHRMGHFVSDTAIRFLEHRGESSDSRIFWVYREPANTFWLDLLRRNLRTTESWAVGQIVQVAGMLSHPPSWFLPQPWKVNGSRDTGLISRSDRTMEFTPSEDQSGCAWLKQIGCESGQPFVCLLVRDSEYLSVDGTHSPESSGRPKDFWSYHNYRDSDINSYVEAAEWLADNGFFVLRMGKIIDFAFHPDRSDFLDVWLFANCSLCVTTGSGPDQIPQIYGRPTLYVNFIPLSHCLTSVPALTAGKALYDKTGRRLSLAEHLTLDLYRTEDYQEQGVQIRDLSSAEICAVVKEGVQRLSGTWEDDGQDQEMQDTFKSILSDSNFHERYGYPLHGYFHPQARLSTRWVQQLETERLESKRR